MISFFGSAVVCFIIVLSVPLSSGTGLSYHISPKRFCQNSVMAKSEFCAILQGARALSISSIGGATPSASQSGREAHQLAGTFRGPSPIQSRSGTPSNRRAAESNRVCGVRPRKSGPGNSRFTPYSLYHLHFPEKYAIISADVFREEGITEKRRMFFALSDEKQFPSLMFSKGAD